MAYAALHHLGLLPSGLGKAPDGTELFSLVVAVAAASFGWVRRRGLGVLLLVGYLPAVVILVGELLT